MAFVKRVRIVYTKGIDAVDPFLVVNVVKPALNRNERQAFEQAYLNGVKNYADLLALCTKYVELDETKPVGTEPEYGAFRDVYSDEPVPWRKLVWDTAFYLLTKTTVSETWDIKVGDHDYRGPNLYLCHRTATGVTSPSAEVEQARHGSGQMVKIRCYPGLAMNAALEKATPVKIAAKLLEHGEKTLSSIKARSERETEQQSKKLKAAKLVRMIENKYGVPRYYEGSSELEINTPGATLRVTPNEYGYASVTLTMGIQSERDTAQLAQVIELVKTLKEANDTAKKAVQHV